MSVANSGKVKGKEVVQMYLGFPKESGEPPKILKGFKKIELNPGESKQVTFQITDRDISTWNENDHHWHVNNGNFTVFIAASSKDIRA